MAYYLNPDNQGIKFAGSTGDGYTIHLTWEKAYANNRNFNVAYHIYMSTLEDKVFDEGVKFVSVDGSTSVDIFDLTPGQLYHFGVRAVEWDPNIIDITQLPTIFNGLKVYPESILTADISATDTVIPLLDVATFPNHGIIKIGVEFINYLSVDQTNNNLILTNAGLQRGFYLTSDRLHNTDGYDGYITWSPTVSFILGREEINTLVYPCQSRFEFNNYQFTIPDGYHQTIKDLLTSASAGSDDATVGTVSTTTSSDGYSTTSTIVGGLLPFDFAGYHRTDPVQLLNGVCVGSYIGGRQFCADGYSGVGSMVSGFSFQEQNNQRLTLLLSIDGEPVNLLRRQWTGITCSCYQPSSEYPDDRCPKCYGTKFVVGWDQYFNPLRSDGRILVRFSPADDVVKQYEAGLESEMFADCWTLIAPIVKHRDILVRFDEDGNEEFRYEIINVNRNKTLNSLNGGQHFRVQRIRKFDVAYQIKVFRNTEFLPRILNTGIGSTTGIPPHTHQIVINENITNPSQINELTSVNFGHNHIIQNGEVVEVLGHSHIIIIP